MRVLTTVALFSLSLSTTQAQITYVDAAEGATGNTFATGVAPSDTAWLNPDAGATSDEDQWAQRAFANNGTVFQALHNGNTIPELTTRISGLPDGTYDLWVFFWDGPNANQWTISTGLNSGNLTTYSFDGPGDTNSPVPAGTLDFVTATQPMTTEGPRIMYGVLLGQQTIAGGAPLAVYIDNTAGGGSNNRTWYDGIGYSLIVPEEDNDGDGIIDSFEQTIIDANDNDDIEGLEDVMGTGAAPATTDFDNDGSDDGEEFERETNPLLPDTDNDGLNDGVESDTGVFQDETDTGTDPLDPDSDDDNTSDGTEVASGTDPNDPESNLKDPFLALDFNRNDQPGSPSQSLFRIIAGSATQEDNSSSYSKTVGPLAVTVSRPDDEPFEFRGANGDSSRFLPGGNTSLSFLVSDFIATRGGELDLTIDPLPAGNYAFRSYHLDPFTGSAHGFSQGSSTTTPNTIEAVFENNVTGTTQPTSLGSVGLNTTSISDNEVPSITFTFTQESTGPASIRLRSTITNGTDQFLLLNGFQLFQVNP